MFIPDPGSEYCPSKIRTFSIPDHGSASKNWSVLTKKMVSKLSVMWSGLFIPDPDPDFLPIPDPGSRGQKGTGSRIRIRNTLLWIPYPAKWRLHRPHSALVRCFLSTTRNHFFCMHSVRQLSALPSKRWNTCTALHCLKAQDAGGGTTANKGSKGTAITIHSPSLN